MSIHDLGIQCHTDNIKDWVLGSDQHGHSTAWLAIDGAPGHPSWLTTVSPTDGSIGRSLPIAGMTGPKAVTQSGDRTIYIGGYHRGALFRHRPGTEVVEDLGLPYADTEFIFGLLPGPGATVYGGTWPTGAAFRWSPDEGFTPIGPAPIRPGHQWLRCVARDDSTGALLFGSGTPAGWTLYDPRLGEHRPIELPWPREQTFGYTVQARSGTAVLVDIDTAWVVRLRREARTVQVHPWYRIDDVQPVQPAIIDPAAGEVVLWRDGRLIRCTARGQTPLTTSRSTPAALCHRSATDDLIWPSNRSISVLPLRRGPSTVHDSRAEAEPRVTPIIGRLPKSPQATSALTIGPDHRVYSGGFLNGGLGVHDPATGEHTELGPIGQPEVIGSWGDDLVVGSYPGAWVQLIAQNALAPDRFTISDRLSFHDDGQDRPYAFTAVNDETAYAGFMADYGHLDGGLVRLQRRSRAAPGDRLRAGPVVIPAGARSVIGLCTAAGTGSEPTVFGTTKIDGGMGIAPTERQAVLFALDPTTDRIRTWTPPVHPCRALYGPVALAGRIWVIAEDRLLGLTVDSGIWEEIPGWPRDSCWPATEERAVTDSGRLRSRSVDPVEDRQFHAHQAMLRIGPRGTLLAGLAGIGLVETDLTARTTRLLWSGEARHLTVADDGATYFVDATSLSLNRLTRPN